MTARVRVRVRVRVSAVHDCEPRRHHPARGVRLDEVALSVGQEARQDEDERPQRRRRHLDHLRLRVLSVLRHPRDRHPELVPDPHARPQELAAGVQPQGRAGAELAQIGAGEDWPAVGGEEAPRVRVEVVRRRGHHLVHLTKLALGELRLQRLDQQLEQIAAAALHTRPQHPRLLRPRRERRLAARVAVPGRARVEKDRDLSVAERLDAQRVEAGPWHRDAHQLGLGREAVRQRAREVPPLVARVGVRAAPLRRHLRRRSPLPRRRRRRR
mmetsp:Transcript_16677/g.54756  ORF Transcript_16677/g.54756 Transcript_16677/m.54756 type:complete len:270 (+) Transcript_16677:1405-2214(+)